MNHECAVPGCKTSIVAGMLMCMHHWYQVSPRTRTWVTRSWQEATCKAVESVRRLELMRQYKSARFSAIAEVLAKREEVTP